jgi:hypothetical protein
MPSEKGSRDEFHQKGLIQSDKCVIQKFNLTFAHKTIAFLQSSVSLRPSQFFFPN